MTNFMNTHEDGMATLSEILEYFNGYKVYFICEHVTPSAVRDVCVVDDNNKLVASFIEWDNDDDGEPCVYLLTEHTDCTLDEAIAEFIAEGFDVEAERID